MNLQTNVSVQTKSLEKDKVTIEVTIPLIRSALEGEEIIQQGVNAVGMLASQKFLKNFDTDGSPIEMGVIKMTSKGQVLKEYNTPYGVVEVERHVYQTSSGGKTFCPLDKDARIIRLATPKLAKMISHKYSRNSVDEVTTDLGNNHGRILSREYIQIISETVGAFAQVKEESWNYSIPQLDTSTSTVSIGVDGITMFMKGEGYRQAMVGRLALYDAKDVGATPEYGKEKFLQRMEVAIKNIKADYPQAKYVGIADGAKDNWTFLEKCTSIQITDFYHATEYITGVSEAIFTKRQEKERQEWLSDSCHRLKHNEGAANQLLQEFKKIKIENKIFQEKMKKVDAAISYFTNQGVRMAYAKFRSQNLPIGSGITEAACKTIIKQRFCGSGMKWKDKEAATVLSLRCLKKSNYWN